MAGRLDRSDRRSRDRELLLLPRRDEQELDVVHGQAALTPQSARVLRIGREPDGTRLDDLDAVSPQALPTPGDGLIVRLAHDGIQGERDDDADHDDHGQDYQQDLHGRER